MTHELRHVRLAGLLYVVIIACGVGGEAFMRGPLIDPTDPGATVTALAAAPLTFRVSVLLDVVMALCDVGLAVLLLAVFQPVSRIGALAATAFRLVQAAILGLNLVNLHSAMALATKLGPQGAVDALAGREAMVAMALEAHAMGYDLGLFFFGINCLLMAWLMRRAASVPNVLAALMTAAGLVYLAGSTLHVVLPDVTPRFAAMYAIPLVAELAFSAWLLVGRVPPTPDPAAASHALA